MPVMNTAIHFINSILQPLIVRLCFDQIKRLRQVVNQNAFLFG